MTKNRKHLVILTWMALLSFAHAGDGRIEINQSKMPMAIWNPGSYVVTENLVVTNESGSGSGISVETSGVTIDVNGFTLSGPGTNAAGAWQGIYASGPIDRVCVRNGGVEGFTYGGIVLYGDNSTVRRMKALRNKENGIRVSDGLITECISAGNEKRGFELGGPVNIHDCVAINNGWQGIYLYGTATIEGCVALDNSGVGIHGRSGTILYNLSSGNDDGVLIDDFDKVATVRGNACSYNTELGFRLDSGALLNDNCAYNNSTNYLLTGSVTAGVNHDGP